MNSKTVKVILGAALVGFMSVSNLLAQDPPAAEVNQDGNLVLNPGTAEEEIIQTPDGTVDQNGDLTVGGVTITKPSATVEPDGSLNLGDGTILQVPDGPPTGQPAFIDWLNVGAHETIPFGPSAPTRHWSYTFKAIDYDEAAPSTAWFRELGAFIFVALESGTKSMDGVWAYAFDWPVDGAGGTWIWISVNNFNTRVETGGDVIEGWLYLAGSPYAKWFFLKEFDSIADAGTYLFVDGESYRLTMQP